MLRGVDKALELAGWVAALALVIMLFAGPQVVAEDEPAQQGGEAAGAAPYAGQAGGAEAEGAAPEEGAAPSGGAAPVDGRAVFTETCGSCHTLSAADTSGAVGPNLDDTSLGAADIEGIVREGSGGMPAFGGQLSDEEIRAVAEFVAGN